jgi:hypothetical protein
MPRQAFVEPSTVKLELAEGDWVEVKRELTYGEQLQLQESSSETDEAGKYHLDVSNFYVNRMVAWVVDWSFEDADGAVVVTPDAVRALRGEIAAEINIALNKYITEGESKN